MVDVSMFVTLSRETLGLPPLEIASDPHYYLSTQFLGAAVAWERQQVTSQWLDGAVTTSRHRQMVTEQIGVEIKGTDLADVERAKTTLIQAFIQDWFTLGIIVGNASRAYDCEAADYQDLSWTTPRLAGAQGQVLFSVPRQPVAHYANSF